MLVRVVVQTGGGLMGPGRPVTVAALTYRRPAGLGRLLPLLVEQAGELSPRAQVLIVDNDPDAGAAAQVGAWADAGVRYVHEPRPGISAGRNRAIDEATASGSAALVFIDDDETPAKDWLARMVEAWRRFDSAAVTGPVIRSTTEGIDPWVAASEIFDRVSLPTGTRRRGGGTGNLLLDLDRLHELGLRFDEAFGLTGGEDTLLLNALTRKGGDIVWCDEAVAVEDYPPQRLTRRGVRRRVFRAGNTFGRVRVALAETSAERYRQRAGMSIRAVWHVAKESAALLAAVATGNLHRRVRAECEIARFAGVVYACVGRTYVEYARSPRSTSTGAKGPTGGP